MTVKIPRFIWIMIQAVVRMFERYESRHQRMVVTVVRETYDDLVLCLNLWEGKTVVPHPHMLEEVSKTFRTSRISRRSTVY